MDKVSEISKAPEVDQNSPYYELAKQVVDELQLAGTIQLLSYPAAINAIIQLLDKRKVVITQR